MIDYHQIAQNSKASQDKEELEELLGTVSRIYPLSILEIGVHRGYSMEVWHKAFPSAVLHGVQDDVSEVDIQDIPQNKYMITQGNSHDSSTLEEVKFRMQTWTDPIDFLFLDGDHMYQAVKLDFEMYSPLVREGGIVAFHDARVTGNYACEVYKFWNEIKHQYKYKEIFSSTGTGTGLLWM